MSYVWQGKLPDPRDDAFAEALAQRRFRTIESAASEEVSVGWVTPADPTGDSFAKEDLDGGTGAWLRCRIDKKTLPTKWLWIHRAAAEKARGKRLSARERRELKDDLQEQLLPRVLPTIQLIDAILFHERRLVLLFATSKAARESFAKLFFETFAVPLEAGDPLRTGLRLLPEAEQQHALEQAEPIRWPDATRPDRRTDASPRLATAKAAESGDLEAEEGSA